MDLVPLSIRLFGSFEVHVRGDRMRSVRTRSVEWLLALLVLRHGREVSRSWLAGAFWPESSEAQAFLNLRRNLMDLRQALGPEAARLHSPARGSLRLDLTGAAVDVADFDQAVAAGDEGSLERAVALYRGPLLEGCGEEWALGERASRAEAYLQALETLADRAAGRGDPAAALGHLLRAEALDPLRDSVQQRRMQALAAMGDLPAALLSFRDYRLRLHREMNLEPDPETTRLFQELCSARSATLRRPGPMDATAAPRPAAAALRTGSLPRLLTPLIGREQELDEATRLVTASPLVTLIGGGGVGKTRLALQVAADLSAAYLGRTAFVELAPLADPALLPAFVAAALGLHEGAGPAAQSLLQTLIGWLSQEPTLLVLDNCEHLLQAAAALAQSLLAACPELHLLATSRQRLGFTGEIAWRVPSLPAPDPERLPVDTPGAVEAVLQFPAARLFVERAGAVRSGFRLRDREEALALARICQRLDGIPLALELAAARAAVLSIPQIAARLDDRFQLLTGGSRTAMPRHQTLRALIDWSYDSLPEQEAALLRRLSVFAGRWTLEAAEAMADDPMADGELSGSDEPAGSGAFVPHPPSAIRSEEVLDLLGSLEDRSLVLVDEVGQGLRYRMLETVREYAGEKLAASGERTALRNRHRDWYLQLAEQAEMASRRREQQQWLTRLEAEIDNLRAALAWCQEAADADPDSDAAAAGLRLAGALFWLWQWRGYFGEGQQWLEGALARGSRCPPALRANALVCMAHLNAAARQHLGLARQEQEKAVLLANAGGEAREIALAVLQMAEIVSLTYDWEAAWRYAAEARERLEALGDRSRLVRAVHMLAQAAGGRGDWEARRRLLEELTGLCRETGDYDILVHALGGLGHLARDAGDLARARTLYGESLVLRREIGNLFAVAQSLEDLAVLAGRERDAERAIRLLGAGEVFCETLGVRPPATIAPEYERTVAEGRATLGEAAFAAAWAEGRAMPLEQAIEYALLAPHDPPPAA